MTRGKIVLIPFPFDDLSSSKVRPALCLTDQIGPFKQIIVAFITSTPVDNSLDSDIILDPSDHGLSATGLRAKSTVRLHRVATVSSSLIVRTLGQLPEPHLENALTKVARLFNST